MRESAPVMVIGIVGSEAAKFTPATETAARVLIRVLIDRATTVHGRRPVVVSGECHLGGVDTFAREEAEHLGCPFEGVAPHHRRWAPDGYKARNEQIARSSDIVYCITVRVLPPTYRGMRFARCYHCQTTDHVKSGGCWTVKVARALGKPGVVLVV